MKRMLIALAALAAFVSPAVAQSHRVLVVYAQEDTTLKPVAGAVVTDLVSGQSTRTDSVGRADLDFLKPIGGVIQNMGRLEIRMPGYEPHEELVPFTNRAALIRVLKPAVPALQKPVLRRVASKP